MSEGLKVLQVSPIESLVEEVLVEGDDLVDVGVFLL